MKIADSMESAKMTVGKSQSPYNRRFQESSYGNIGEAIYSMESVFSGIIVTVLLYVFDCCCDQRTFVLCVGCQKDPWVHVSRVCTSTGTYGCPNAERDWS